MVFQDPMTSLNPVLRIARQMDRRRWRCTGVAPLTRASGRSSLLGRMGIHAPERAARSFPHQFSGGMRQRVVLAMGMSNEPALLLADEPTTALDVTIQAQILELMRELNRDFGTAIVLISHDLGVIAGVCSRVLVMYAGEVVEEGPTEQVLAEPRHPYTWALMNAVPRLGMTAGGRLTTIEGMPPDPLSTPPGCRFAPRCPFRVEKCAEHPALFPMGPGRTSRCWVAADGVHFPSPARPRRRRRGNAARAGAGRCCRRADLVKHFPLRARLLRPATGRARGRRDRPRHPPRRGAGRGRRERLRQEHARPHAVMRLYKPDAGEILFDGTTIAARARRRSARCAAGCRWCSRTPTRASTRA